MLTSFPFSAINDLIRMRQWMGYLRLYIFMMKYKCICMHPKIIALRQESVTNLLHSMKCHLHLRNFTIDLDLGTMSGIVRNVDLCVCLWLEVYHLSYVQTSDRYHPRVSLGRLRYGSRRRTAGHAPVCVYCRRPHQDSSVSRLTDDCEAPSVNSYGFI